MKQKTLKCGAALLVMALVGAPAEACFFGEFSISTVPALPEANEDFELVVDYSASEAGCFIAEDLVVSAAETIRFDITCYCIFIRPDPVPRQFRSVVPGLPAGIYDFEAIHVDAGPAPQTLASTHILIGHAPAIPLSPLALTLLALTLAAAAVWVLRR